MFFAELGFALPPLLCWDFGLQGSTPCVTPANSAPDGLTNLNILESLLMPFQLGEGDIQFIL